MRGDRVFENIKRLAPTYLRVRRLAEPQTSRSIVRLASGGEQAREVAPVNVAAVDLADRIERGVQGWMDEARKLGAAVAPAESYPQPMTVHAAAKALHCSEERIYALIRQGRLEGVVFGRRRFVWSTDVEDYAAAQRELRERRA